MKKVSSKPSSRSAKTVRAARPKRSRRVVDELRPDYDFDYANSRPNRFATKSTAGDAVAVVLDPDVATVFRSSEAVNSFLRSVISAIPPVERSSKRRAS